MRKVRRTLVSVIPEPARASRTQRRLVNVSSRKIGTLMAAFGAVLVSALSLAAAADSGIVLTVEVQEEISVPNEKGEVQIIHREVEMADPGDVLVYTLTYKNTGTAPARDAVVNDAVPEGTILLPGSVKGEKSAISYSVDGGKSFAGFPAKLQVASMHGAPVSKPAPPEAYTHIRWTAATPLAPGESRTATFKVIVR
jgi:uncharacterized repeat protein (TIGR01451 family)